MFGEAAENSVGKGGGSTFVLGRVERLDGREVRVGTLFNVDYCGGRRDPADVIWFSCTLLAEGSVRMKFSSIRVHVQKSSINDFLT